MAEITAANVAKLREMTGVGMMECKKALVEAQGNIDTAVDILRKSGAASGAKNATRAANEGVIAQYVAAGGKSGLLLEVNCETDFVARNEAFRNFADELARKVALQGGAILALDYGYASTQTGETLQAVKSHAFADVLDEPGDADISAHVNFGVLGDAARADGLAVPPIVNQGDFLIRLGLGERAKALALANPKEAANIARAIERLTSPQQMGSLFKVFCAHSPGLRPAGFA